MVPVIILNWNGWDDTFVCLRSLAQAEGVSEVWLVDNASRDDRSCEVAEHHPSVRVLRWDDNYGWAGGNNRALRLAVSEGYQFAYLLNNDSLVKPGFLRAVEQAIATDERIAAVGSWVAYAEDPEYLCYDGEFHALGTKRIYRSGVRFGQEFHGAGVLIRLSAMEQDGFFDERLFCYCEELEWCARLADRGWKFAQCGDSLILHHGGHSDVSANRAYYMTRNRFVLVNRVPAERRRIAYSSAVYHAIVGAAVAKQEGEREKHEAMIAGLYDGLRQSFGRRSDAELPRGFNRKIQWLHYGAMLRDKWRSVCGCSPGYPPIEALLARD